ncbi:aminotransferase class I/II-fold pyridoxal phosphate-dependent enzyme [Nonomuraea turkmeniaca]|uniref:aminotransferase class I/II-fold pyridoxal phosphate-dependent enzyme n=1 Tax=Nonomuraea turkmeniaca TaxID=103838 RepID=UPI001477230F|nr:aminotransferase class I/II-fold pyridoxal phosphate-dependent enzyme [Nonomuraea turkmeniaca]
MDGLTVAHLERAIADGGTGNADVARDLEQRFAAFAGTARALCVSSGTIALMCALYAVGVRPGQRVAVSVLGPAMTGLAVAAVGATPVFVDCCSPTSFGLDADALERAARNGVAAAIAVPMWGYWDEDAAALHRLRAAGVPVILDLAQAPFLRLRQGLSDVADISCFSLHGRKPLKAGEGGVCLTGDQRLAERILAVRNFGQRAELAGGRLIPAGPFGARFGANAKINALGAAWCLAQMDAIDTIRDRHTRLREVATDLLTATGTTWAEASESDDVVEHGRYGIVAMCPSPGEARQLAGSLHDDGLEVDSLRYRYAPMTDAPYFARLAAAPCPNARRLTKTVVACRLEAFASRLPKE